MWSYYGSKNRIVRYYPKPVHHKIVEPFAGAAYYSLRYFENDVLLIDKNPMIVNIWHYLQSASERDINSLPRLAAGHRITREQFECEGQYQLMRYLIVQAAYGGGNVVSKWGAMRIDQNIKRVAANLFKIKHWTIFHADYAQAPECKATWFVDAPYFIGGDKYPFKAKYIDFNHLSLWCRQLNGQVIVCENTNAGWLPFSPLVKIQGVAKTSTEVIWTNYPTAFMNTQQQLWLSREGAA